MNNLENYNIKKLMKNNSESNLLNKHNVNNIKSIKISDVFKNIYDQNAGKALKNLQKENNLLKYVNNNSSVISNNSQESFTGSAHRKYSNEINNNPITLKQDKPSTKQSGELSKDFLNKMKNDKKTLSPIREGTGNDNNNNNIHKYVPRLSQSLNRSQYLIGANETNKSLISLSKDSNLVNKPEDKLFMTRTEFRNSIGKNDNNDQYYNNNGSNFAETQRLIDEIGSKALKKFIDNSQDKKFYCPYCEHCNVIKEDQMEKYIYSIKESKNIINTAFNFITTSDIILGNELNLFKSVPLENKNASDKKDINFINQIPKQAVGTRLTHRIVAHYLDALVEEKISYEQIANPEIVKKLNECIYPKGMAFEVIDNDPIFDPEFEKILDDKTRALINKLTKEKFLTTRKDDIIDSKIIAEKDGEPIDEQEPANIKKNEQANKEQEEIAKNRQRFLLLFLVFIQLLSEIFQDCKERAALMYKFVKLYFAEQEKRWAIVINKMKDKIKIYKEICESFVKQNDVMVEKVELVNDILFSQRLTTENLKRHKGLIQKFLHLINEKRDQAYLQETNLEMTKKEARFFVFEFDIIKINKIVKDRLKTLSDKDILENIKHEVAHKSISRAELACLVNADRFLLISGQRSYFFEQKNFYLKEISRLEKLYNKFRFKKQTYKQKWMDKTDEYNHMIDRMEKQVENFRNMIYANKSTITTQTNIDQTMFDKIIKNHDSVKAYKNLSKNRLATYFERIKYNISKEKPISIISLLAFIPEVYNEKMENDNKQVFEGFRKNSMDEFLYQFLLDRFKLKKLVKKHIEETIMAVLKYAGDDERVSLFSQFLGIDTQIRRELLDHYLSVIKGIFLLIFIALPFSFFKLFGDDYKNYLMNTEFCFEILRSKLPKFKLIHENKDVLLKQSICYNNKKIITVNEVKKFEVLILSRFYTKSLSFFNVIINDFKTGKKTQLDRRTLSDQIKISTAEFELEDLFINNLLENYFGEDLTEDDVSLDVFFKFFDSNNFEMKIQAYEFVEVTFKTVTMIYSWVLNKITQFWDFVDFTKEGIMFFKNFEKLMLILVKDTENKWKITEYFNMAGATIEKEFVSKEEYIIFVLNNEDILQMYLDLFFRK